jgi:hypothetical protein
LKITIPNIARQKWLRGFFISALFASFSAQAATVIESEPNDTRATAQVLVHDGSISLRGSIEDTPNGTANDYFRFSATEGSDIVFNIYSDENPSSNGDIYFRLLSNTGRNLAGGSLGLSGGFYFPINYKINRTGDYFAAVGGLGTGGVAYTMSITGLTPVSPIPEPGEWAMMLCGLGVVGAIARRRRARLKP